MDRNILKLEKYTLILKIKRFFKIILSHLDMITIKEYLTKLRKDFFKPVVGVLRIKGAINPNQY